MGINLGSTIIDKKERIDDGGKEIGNEGEREAERERHTHTYRRTRIRA